MKIAVMGARLFLGFIYFFFGLNQWMAFLPLSDPHPFIETLSDSGYFVVIKALEVIAGAMLLTNFYVPVALIILGPISTNILLYAIFFDQRFLIPDIIFFGLTVFLIWAYWWYYKRVLTRSAVPGN